jgi:predicted small integral membrane protein
MQPLPNIDLWLALGVVTATALTDAVCVLFTASIVRRKAVAAASFSSLSYMLSSFAVISFTSNWFYVVPAALGSWLGAYITMRCLNGPVEHVDQVLDEVFASMPGMAGEVVSARRLQLQPVPAPNVASSHRLAA